MTEDSSLIAPGEHPRRRGGRPTVEQAGEVDRRILQAATGLFLRQGFDATSCDQVAAAAGAGKASIYARYANKEELFSAVVHDSVGSTLASAFDIPWHLPVDERLRATGYALLSHAVRPEVVALMRMVSSTAQRLPDLARLANRIGSEGHSALVAAAILGERAASPEAMADTMPIAAIFVDLTFTSYLMRALMGEEPAALEAAAPARIAETLDLLAGAGWLKR